MVNKSYQKRKKSFEKKDLKCTKVSLKMKKSEKRLWTETKIFLKRKRKLSFEKLLFSTYKIILGFYNKPLKIRKYFNI